MSRYAQALARSRAAISSADKRRSVAGRRAASCSGELAPMRGMVLAGLVICQERATLARVVLWDEATASSASMTAKPGAFIYSLTLPARALFGAGCPGRYLPVRNPAAGGVDGG